MTSAVLRTTGQYWYFIECPFAVICLIFFSWLDWDYGFEGSRLQRLSAIFITLHQGYMLFTWLITVDINHGWGKVVSVRFLHFNYSCPPIFPYYTLWKAVTVCSPHLRNRELCFLSLSRVEPTCFWPPCYFSYLTMFFLALTSTLSYCPFFLFLFMVKFLKGLFILQFLQSPWTYSSEAFTPTASLKCLLSKVTVTESNG